MSVQKVPPQDELAERSVLGAILIDPSSLSTVLEIVLPEAFYFERNRSIFTAMLGLYEKHQPVDIITLTAELKQLALLDKVGDTSYLSELIDTVPTSAYVEHYAKIVKGQYIKRSLISSASRIVEESFQDDADITELLNHAESTIFGLSQQYIHRNFIDLRSILSDSFARLEDLVKHGTGLRGVPTGFADLDAKLAGFQQSNLIILAARPGVGKTTLALNMALHAALKEKVPIGFFSLEMSKEELVDRLLVGQADIDAWRLKTGKLSDDDYERITDAMGELAEAPIYIDDTPGAPMLEMMTKARKLKLEKGLGLIIVDYLQLIAPGKKFESRVQEVSFVSQQLKNMARELRIPVIALSQLSRAIEHRGEKRPQLADLRESGSIEQDADVVMFIYKEKEDEDLVVDSSKSIAKLYIAKHRNGAIGEIDLMFRGDRVKFYGIER
jgi:replicative DNA helicase